MSIMAMPKTIPATSSLSPRRNVTDNPLEIDDRMVSEVILDQRNPNVPKELTMIDMSRTVAALHDELMFEKDNSNAC